MKEIYKVKTRGKALDVNIVKGENYRITLLTEGLVRFEYAQDGIFEDRPTQFAFFRDFDKTEYRVIKTQDGIEIHTSRLHIIYDEKAFSSSGLSIQVKGNLSPYHSTWRYGEKDCPDYPWSTRGTARTLDTVDGETELEGGIISAAGYAVLHDSKSQILLEDGWAEPRKKGIEDFYFFGYGHDYKEALKDFYYLSGKTPMLPRYALGNWWSRYYKYSEDSYMELMNRFQKENLPFTVAVIDMDWHLVDIDPKYGSGWTGYTWNKELFPDPKRFLRNLHEMGMHTTLNLHPADGVKAHEEMYVPMAKAMGVNYEQEDPIACDVADPKFMEAYFEYLHHPREEEGVDFWWIDWQQGSHCKMEGLDPLWVLNHFHFLDSRRNGKRPMTFSRYAGPGSHRYPIGFSGDTWTTWASLDFQPFFTSSASNIGYGWWSHDIGGHMGGSKNDEMTVRWTQSGLYSPILRLHSSNNEFNGKEPWRFKKEAEKAMGDALRQRHQMMPYLYTMNYRAYEKDLPLILPMYYDYPEKDAAYRMKNQFMFGTELLVAPITSKRIEGLNVAKVNVWLPEGLWYDIYTGLMYEGDREITMYRDLNSIPVLAKAGGILPLTEQIDGKDVISNPDCFYVKIFSGADGSFELYEDDNETCAYEQGDCVKTNFRYREGEKLILDIDAAVGNLSLIPEERAYTLAFAGLKKDNEKQVQIMAGDKKIDALITYDDKKQAMIITLPKVSVKDKIHIEIDVELKGVENKTLENCFDFLNQAEIDFGMKDQIYSLIQREHRIPVLLAALQAMEVEKDLLGAMTELLTAM